MSIVNLDRLILSVYSVLFPCFLAVDEVHKSSTDTYKLNITPVKVLLFQFYSRESTKVLDFFMYLSKKVLIGYFI